VIVPEVEKTFAQSALIVAEPPGHDVVAWPKSANTERPGAPARRNMSLDPSIACRFRAIALVAVCCLASGTSSAGKPGDLPVTAAVSAWVQGWNAHDAKSLGRLLTSDVEFVLVNGVELQGRDEFVRVHGEQFGGRYDKSQFSQDGEVAVSFIKPDVALAHWRWIITGVRNPDGTAAPTYKGIFTWVMVASGGTWEVRAAQNTVDKQVASQ
jgi:uncharacterized protein (TIGR02246 family)